MKVYDLHELTDSRILYDKEPPKFMFYILCVLTGLLFVAFLWAAFSHKTGIIKMQAVVSTTDKRLIMIPTQGVINKIEVQENSQVKENDILLILDDLPVRVQMETLDAQIVYLEEYLAKLTILTERLLQINLSTLTGISNPFNGSDADELYWFNQYKACVKQIQAVATVVPDPLQPDTTIPKPSEELIAEREEILDGYVNQYLQQKGQYEYEILGKNSQRNSYAESLDLYIVKAPVSGRVHFNAPVNIGTVLDVGNVIGTITQDVTKENALIEAYLPAYQRVFVEVNDEVEIAISGLLTSEYGVLKGEVILIDTDVITDQENNATFYRVLIKPNKIVLSEKNGGISLITGLNGEARIKYDDITWLKWLGKQIGIRS